MIALTVSLVPSYAYDEEYEEQTRTYTVEEERIIEEKVTKRLESMPTLSAYKPKVVIDPGHGGKDSGAVSTDRKFIEKNLNIDIANAAAQYLRDNGVEVVMTRSTDEWIELKERSSLSNRVSPLLFVSIHNDKGEGNGNGAHVIYQIYKR